MAPFPNSVILDSLRTTSILHRDARTGKITRHFRRYHCALGTRSLERIRCRLVRPLARGHPHRTRSFRLLFPDRYLHYPQHHPEPDLLAVPSLNRMAVKTRTRPTRRARLEEHIARLVQCRRCPRMIPPPVSGGPVVSKIMLIGQAPGVREPVLKRPFAHTAGKTLFRWFEEFCGLNEAELRQKIYFAAVCRCFPGKAPGGTDRVPNPQEIRNCSSWRNDEFEILRPDLVIPVGRLAIAQFISLVRMEEVIGRRFRMRRERIEYDLIPLPHPSGASPWHKIPPGRDLLGKAMRLIARHETIKELRTGTQ
jgi:uracil-DNA glycosylase